MKSRTRLLIAITCIMSFVGCVAQPDAVTQDQKILERLDDQKVESLSENKRARAWAEDLEQLSTELKANHKDLYKNISETALDAEFELLINRATGFNDDEMMIEIMRIIEKIGDGHTYLEWYYEYNETVMPLKFVRIDEEIYCVNATESYRDLLFKKITTIEGLETGVLYAKLAELVPAENDHWKEVNILGLMRVPMFLKALKLTNDPNFTYLTYEDGGQLKQVRIENMSAEKNNHEDFVLTTPMHNLVSSIDMIEGDNYWFEHDKKNKIVKINFDWCINTEAYSFSQFSDDVWNYISTNNIEKVVVDMRNNMGGQSSVFDAFRSGLLKHEVYNDQDRLFVLVGNRTFSSGVASAAMTKRWTNATLVGQPTGGKPNSYGNARQIKLAHSGLRLICSTRYFEFYPGYDKNTLVPDVVIEKSLDDYKNNSDPVYNYVVEK